MHFFSSNNDCISIFHITGKCSGKEKRPNWQDESIYYIMVDRFNDGDSKNEADVDTKNPLSFNGGDFQGIIDKLDYIKDMGFTAIH